MVKDDEPVTDSPGQYGGKTIDGLTGEVRGRTDNQKLRRNNENNAKRIRRC